MGMCLLKVLLRSSLKDKDIGEDIHHLLYVTFLSYVFVLAIRCVGKTSFSPVSSSVATQKLFSPLNCPTETTGAIGGYEKNVSDDTKMIQILSDILPLESSGLRLLSFPAFTSGTMEFTLKKLETQIAQLNAENDKLWNQINQLKEVIKQTVGRSLNFFLTSKEILFFIHLRSLAERRRHKKRFNRTDRYPFRFWKNN